MFCFLNDVMVVVVVVFVCFLGDMFCFLNDFMVVVAVVVFHFCRNSLCEDGLCVFCSFWGVLT